MGYNLSSSLSSSGESNVQPELADFFCKGPDINYFSLCGPKCLCHSYSQLCCCSRKTARMNGCNYASSPGMECGSNNWGDQVICLHLPVTQYFLKMGTVIVAVITTLNMFIWSFHKHFLHQLVCQAWGTQTWLCSGPCPKGCPRRFFGRSRRVGIEES